jgi:acyl carrier protein
MVQLKGRQAMEDTITTTAPPVGDRPRLVHSIGLVLGRVLRRELTDVQESTRLMEDLNLDSTSVLELLLELEDELAIEIDVEGIERSDFATVGTVADLVTRQAGG